ncbi:H-NS histone family protein [Methylomonas rivi]|uniref:H-NS histone family protein n=1 Tax=Methylomonas rivi TaxID=2952226 RepID=A0ABT1TZX2_9GAMM|nr:H-NS histone family protein [Methylomonas sp. WSC-6]MBS4050338.1 H-NS histone family protein [Methylomonas sp.]MCQ8127110.1 H-NS histone family protein [Methylomonas sp. WSC-6]
MTDFNNLSETEIQALIDNAEKALKEKQSSKRKEVIAKIKELAASIGVAVELVEGDKKVERKTGKVAAKYRNPADASQTWTGRGLAPKWMQDLLAAGRNKAEFEIK